MNYLLNEKAIVKCSFIGVFITIEGFVLQVLKGQLIFKKEAPTVEFIIAVTIFYFLTGFLFAVGYFILKNHLPGKTRIRKGLFYGVLIFFGVAFGGIMGMIGLDFSGKFNLLSEYKLEGYLITLVDGCSFILTGIVLGVIAEKKGYEQIRLGINIKKIWPASVIGFFLFPLLNAGLFYIIASIAGSGFMIPAGSETWFYAGIFTPLAITGAVIPLFFKIAMHKFTGNNLQKGMKFILFYYLCYWIINVLFGLPFGFSIHAVINFLSMPIIPLFVLIVLSVRIIQRKQLKRGEESV